MGASGHGDELGVDLVVVEVEGPDSTQNDHAPQGGVGDAAVAIHRDNRHSVEVAAEQNFDQKLDALEEDNFHCCYLESEGALQDSILLEEDSGDSEDEHEDDLERSCSCYSEDALAEDRMRLESQPWAVLDQQLQETCRENRTAILHCSKQTLEREEPVGHPCSKVVPVIQEHAANETEGVAVEALLQRYGPSAREWSEVELRPLYPYFQKDHRPQ